MFSSLRQSTDIIEKLRKNSFEPAHADYYRGKPGRPLNLILKARHDFLSVWRKGDYTDRVTAMNVFGRQIVVVNSPDAIRYVVAKRHENFERKTPQMRRAGIPFGRRAVHFRWRDMEAAAPAGQRYRPQEPCAGFQQDHGKHHKRASASLGIPSRRRTCERASKWPA
ncbi:hypothetical protein LP421_21615 [Rhizobium sp. RCAM05350]|nr:hypothetical protein LP421_21615 [Rhizobium sp. RCAM05350]